MNHAGSKNGQSCRRKKGRCLGSTSRATGQPDGPEFSNLPEANALPQAARLPEEIDKLMDWRPASELDLAELVLRMSADAQANNRVPRSSMAATMHDCMKENATELAPGVHFKPLTAAGFAEMLPKLQASLSQDERSAADSDLDGQPELRAGLQGKGVSTTTNSRSRPPSNPAAKAAKPSADSGLCRAFFDKPCARSAAASQQKRGNAQDCASAKASARTATKQRQSNLPQASTAQPHAAASSKIPNTPARANSSGSKLGTHFLHHSNSADGSTVSTVSTQSSCAGDGARTRAGPKVQTSTASLKPPGTMHGLMSVEAMKAPTASEALKGPTETKDMQFSKACRPGMAEPGPEAAVRRADEAAAALILEDQKEREMKLLRQQMHQARLEKAAARKANVKAKAAQPVRGNSAMQVSGSQIPLGPDLALPVIQGTSAQKATKSLSADLKKNKANVPPSLLSAHAQLDLAMAADSAAELQTAIMSTVKALAALKPGQAGVDETKSRISAANCMLRAHQATSASRVPPSRPSPQQSGCMQHTGEVEPASIYQLQKPTSCLLSGLNNSKKTSLTAEPISKNTADAGSLAPSDGMGAWNDLSSLCVVCLDSKPQIVFAPCQHAVACRGCTAKIIAKSSECPVCRCQISATHLV
ncbi:hypothetical protein WJX74_003466 [Apatococcus lobatus]|uniref:RING-type domain-containing protein n=1 Tax=Apatococcus lobatus TaxID=904363 RepID=A0AAW1QB04_9CHLO